MGRRVTLEEGGIMAAKQPSIKAPTKEERIKKWVDEENKRSKELAQRKKDVDAAFAAWAKAEDRERRMHGPDVPTRAGHSRKKGDKIRNK